MSGTKMNLASYSVMNTYMYSWTWYVPIFLIMNSFIIFFLYFISELIYCGKKLLDDQKLESVGLKAGATVFALKKYVTEKDDSIGRHNTFFFVQCLGGSVKFLFVFLCLLDNKSSVIF